MFTRPRRFGKTLSMSMLKSFFEIDTNEALFDGLEILKEKELCKQYMGQFPVIFISLKSVEGLTFESSLKKMGNIIQDEARRVQFLLKSEQLTEIDKKLLKTMFEDEINLEEQQRCLKVLSELLYKHYGKKVIILIDEYDVPLDKAYENGYYDSMVSHVRGIFQALKTNEYLHFAVLTGCLRISKESVFTGLNNLKVLTITDVRFNEYFGFTDSEVKRLLSYYNLTEYYDTIKDWYNGYHFGNVDVYCPWDVINYCDKLISDPKAQPEAYWVNTSSNNIIRRFIESAKASTKKDIEKLIDGESISKEITQELTYKDIDDSIAEDLVDNLWSVLYTTGYLTYKGIDDDGKYRLVIPNKEVRWIFEKQIKLWFERKVKSDLPKLRRFW
jgi:hypothetical protein